MPYKKKEGLFSKKNQPNHYKKGAQGASTGDAEKVIIPISTSKTEQRPEPVRRAAPEQPRPEQTRSEQVRPRKNQEANIPQPLNKPKAVSQETAGKPQAKAKSKLPMGAVVGLIVIVLAIIAAGVLAVFLLKDDNADETTLPADATPGIVVPSGYFAKENFDYTFLKSMKAIKLTAGVDFYTNEAATAEEIAAEADKIIETVQGFEFNSIIVDARRDESAIFKSNVLQTTQVDAMEIFSQKAEEAGISILATYDIVGARLQDGTKIENHLSYQSKQHAADAAVELASGYKLNSIMLSGYLSEKTPQAYAEYIRYGIPTDYNSFMYKNSQAAIEQVVEAIHNAKNSLPVGMLVKEVWANADQNVDGSQTKAEYSALINGFADTRKMVADKVVDFVNVEIASTIASESIPFGTLAEWWGKLCSDTQTPLYITHNSINANAEGAGTDQLAQQFAVASKVTSYHGSGYIGLQSMVDHIDDSTDILLKRYSNEYSDEDLFQGLDMSLPQAQQSSTYEETVQFRGKFDPNQEVFINGEKVEPSERGGFSVWVPLNVGQNNIVLEHKGKKITYKVERKVDVLRAINPTKDMTVGGSSQIEVNVIAYKGSSISATLNGTTVPLQEGGIGDESMMDTSYVNYQGFLPVPKAQKEDTPIGNITVYGKYMVYQESAKGSAITVAKIPDEVDPDEATGSILQHAIVNTTYADVVPYETTPQWAQSILYQLPYGTQDIVQSVSGDFINLRSGKTVKRSDVSLEMLPFEGNNAITDFRTSVEGGDTVMRLGFMWKAPFSINPSPYPTNTDSMPNNYTFNGNTITLLFDYTTRVDAERFVTDLGGSSLFSGITHERVRNEERNIWQYKITLTLSQVGKYYGAHAEYEGNTLVIRFNNPLGGGSLQGLVVAVDAGHGGTDYGTMAGRDVLEKEINLIMAQKVKAQLEAHGATVIMTRTGDETLSLEQRVDIAHRNKVDLFISCHHNSQNGGSSAHGVETYFNTPYSAPLAQSVHSQLIQHINDRGRKTKNFLVAREKQYPSILIEYGFLSNVGDEQLALNQAHQDNMARATVQGILNYYS